MKNKTEQLQKEIDRLTEVKNKLKIKILYNIITGTNYFSFKENGLL